MIIWTIIGSTWIFGYRNLITATNLILFELGLRDKLTNVQVGGESMLPTIKNGETISLHNPHKFTPEKGDIVSFKNIESSDSYYIKRIIATEGEQILLENGRVQVNSMMLSENYILNNSLTYGNTFLLDCKPYTIPKGKVVVMGDNRNASTDSRVIGFGTTRLPMGKPSKGTTANG